jgi:hypothetical protein
MRKMVMKSIRPGHPLYIGGIFFIGIPSNLVVITNTASSFLRFKPCEGRIPFNDFSLRTSSFVLLFASILSQTVWTNITLVDSRYGWFRYKYPGQRYTNPRWSADAMPLSRSTFCTQIGINLLKLNSSFLAVAI